VYGRCVNSSQASYGMVPGRKSVVRATGREFLGLAWVGCNRRGPTTRPRVTFANRSTFRMGLEQ